MERVLVIEREVLFLDGYWKGVKADLSDELIERITQKAFFTDRDPAEKNTDLKQIIPYVYITRGDEFFLAYRLKKQTESRLHNLYSLGIGGHINPCDEDNGEGDLVTAGMFRELDEEIFLPEGSRPALKGILNFDDDPVGQVHVGFVYNLETEADIEIREKEHMAGSFVSYTGLLEKYEAMEGWSRQLFDDLIRR